MQASIKFASFGTPQERVVPSEEETALPAPHMMHSIGKESCPVTLSNNNFGKELCPNTLK
ncbi:putative beta-galactosidase [Helianthus anomalus]